MKLETRFCKCNCGASFRCLPTSKQEYSSLECKEKALAPKRVKKKNTRNPPDGMVGAREMSRILGLSFNHFNYWVRKLNLPYIKTGTVDRWFDVNEVKNIWNKQLFLSRLN